MDYEREMDKVMMNIRQTGGGITSLLLYSAQMQMQFLVFLMRMTKKSLLSTGVLGEYQKFMEKTEGDFTVYNIPVSEGTRDKILKIQSMEKQKESASVLEKKSLQKEIDTLKQNLPELSQLNSLQVSHYLFPKLNAQDQTMQLAVAKSDQPTFKNWFLNHLNANLSGGKTSLQDLKAFTEGNYSLYNMPFEGDSLADMVHDLDILGINYSILPDLKVGDGYTQIAVANKDTGSLDSWFSMWKDKQLSEGKEIREYRKINQEDYMETAAIDAEEYKEKADPQYAAANAGYEKEAKDVVLPQKMQTENSRSFVEFIKNPDYEKITVNKETLVDNFVRPKGAGLMENTAPGYFLSRLPGTYGDSQKTLIVPKSNVFLADDGKTYLAFLPVHAKTMVLDPAGKIERLPLEDVKASYDKVQRGFQKVEALKKDLEKNMAQDIGKNLEKGMDTVLKKL